jgi:hypothetical protein
MVFAIIVVCGYVLGWMWTGLPKKALWDWQDLSIVPAVLALGGTSSPGRRSARRGRRPTRDPATLGGLSAGASGSGKSCLWRAHFVMCRAPVARWSWMLFLMLRRG